MKTHIHFWSYLAQFFWEWEMFQKSCRGDQNTHFVFRNSFSKIVPFMKYCGKILSSGASHRWQYDACKLRAGYLRLKIHSHNSNTCCFSTAKFVSITLLNIRLFARGLSCYGISWVCEYSYRGPQIWSLFCHSVNYVWLFYFFS
jgi:hypothetical protein